MTDAKLKSYVDRVKALLMEQKTIGADITQVCKEAKEADPDLEPAMIRFAARELLMDSAKRNERDDKRQRYLHAVGLAVDMVSNGDVSLREAARACGVSKSSIHRALAVPAPSQEGDAGSAEEITPKHKPACILPPPAAWQEITLVRDAAHAAWTAEAACIAAEKEAERERKRLEREAEKARNRAITEDPLEHPAFLVRH